MRSTRRASGLSDLWYHVGVLTFYDDGTAPLSWSPAHQFDYGYAPSVSVCGGSVIEVHEGEPGTLWYSTGTVVNDYSAITWTASAQYDSGYYPSVSACSGPEGAQGPNTVAYIVEVQQAGNPAKGKSPALWSHVEQWTTRPSPPPPTVTWTPATKYDNGCRPTVTWSGAVSTAGSGSQGIVETHSGACGEASSLYYDIGTVTFP